MNRPRQARCRLAAIFVAAQLAVFSLAAQTATNVPPPDFFGQLRQLIAMTPDERGIYLTNKPPEIRDRILAKVSEYEALDPDERELRLRATELRWYLQPLMEASPTNRAAQLARVPEDLREIVQSRLNEWMILPPELQEEFLKNERTLHYFDQVVSTNELAILPDEKSRRFAVQFNQFFELTPDEKQETLNTLSDAERAQMQKTLQAFDKMPPMQRDECIRAFAKFAGMSAAEKEEFLKNAARWSEMSPSERQAWRDLVVNVPQWPPLPQGFVPAPPPDIHSQMATNRN